MMSIGDELSTDAQVVLEGSIERDLVRECVREEVVLDLERFVFFDEVVREDVIDNPGLELVCVGCAECSGFVGTCLGASDGHDDDGVSCLGQIEE